MQAQRWVRMVYIYMVTMCGLQVAAVDVEGATDTERGGGQMTHTHTSTTHFNTLHETHIAGDLPPVEVSDDGRFATVANGTSPIPIGLYAMVFATYPPPPPHTGKGQFAPMTQKDWISIVENEYIAGISLHFTWADIQPLPPPAQYQFGPLSDVLDSIDKACIACGRSPACLPVFLKPYLGHHPNWTYTGPEYPVPTVTTNALGMRVVVRPSVNGTDLWNRYAPADQAGPGRAIPISTDSYWQKNVVKLASEIGNWLGRVDPNASRVSVLHFCPPTMSSIQMRPGPSELFTYMSNEGVDKLGMGWTKKGHISAWQAAARDFGSASIEFEKRAWVFDFTVLPPSHANVSQLFFDTEDQLKVFNVLARSHPKGPEAVIAKTESLHVDLKRDSISSTCEFVPDPYHSQQAFPFQFNNSFGIPYNFIGNRIGRHGWENFAALEMPALPFNKSQIPSMYPVPLLANFSMFIDMNNSSPSIPQGSLWAEIWRHESVNVSAFPICIKSDQLKVQLLNWDRALRTTFK